MKTIMLKRILIFIGLILTLTTLSLVSAAPGEETHHAGLLIDYGDGRVDTYCVGFTADALTGYELLERSEVDAKVAFDNASAAVCRIGGDNGLGCAISNCFCQMPLYWSYWLEADGAWAYSNTGLSSTTVRDGDVHGLAWGNGSAAPALTTFEEICPAATDPTATLTPTSSPVSPQAAAPTASPFPSAKFWADTEDLEAGNCTVLRWKTTDTAEVWLDEIEVKAEGADDVCPCATKTHTLKVFFNDGRTETQSLTLDVEGHCEDEGGGMIVITPTPSPTPQEQKPTPTPTPTPSPILDTQPDATATPAEPLSALPTPRLLSSPTPRTNTTPTTTPPPQTSPSPTIMPADTHTPTPLATAALADAPTITASQALPPSQTETDTTNSSNTIHISAHLPTATPGEATTTAESTPPLAITGAGSYFVFGLLLVGLGSAHLFIQKRSMPQ